MHDRLLVLGWFVALTFVDGCRSQSTTLSQPQAPNHPLSSPVDATASLSAAGSGAVGPATRGSAGAPPATCPGPQRNFALTPGTPCGPLDCRSFDRAEDALAYVMRETSPVVLAVGEIHAQKDSKLEASPTRRFASLLPLFCGAARHIVIELWTGRNDCGDQRVEEVRRAQKPITRAQAATNQDDFFELGNVAKQNRIMPHAMTPSCEDYQSILAAKDAGVARMLELTATRSAELAEQLLADKRGGASVPQVLLYGGAMHNDIAPPQGREAFSYGPRLMASTKGRLTELDIVLREQVRDSESFRRFPWYEYFQGETLEKRFTLYRLGQRSFTLIYPSEAYLP